MNSNHHILTSALTLALCAQSALLAADFDWPQWQGPDRNSMSKETGLLQTWPEGGPPLAWKIEGLGNGHGGLAVSRGRIYVMGEDNDGLVWLLALNEADGSPVWKSRIGRGGRLGMGVVPNGPRATPTVDGDRIYALSHQGALVCFTTEGEEVWRTELVSDHGGIVPLWGYAESPLIDGDKLVCTPGGPEALLVALDKRTGKLIWKSPSPAAPAAPAAAPAQNTSAGIAGTEDPGLYTSERWGMRAFATKLPNGHYLAKLHFAETYDGITGPGQRVFSFSVQGQEYKDFDVWAKAGGPNRAHIETVPVEVTNGEFRIVFTAQVENPAIKAIEILPRSEAAGGAAPAVTAVRIKAGSTAPFTDSRGQVWQPDSGFEGGMVSQMSGAPGGSGVGPGRRGGAGDGSGRSEAGYSSVIAVDFEGQRQYVQLTGTMVLGVAAADGKFLWRYNRPANTHRINCSTPLFHEGRVFASTAYDGLGGLARLTKDESGSLRAEEVWFSRNLKNHHGGVILLDGCLYGANGGNEGGALVCLDFNTGDVLWDGRELEGRPAPKGAIAFADGRLYYRTENGPVLLIEPSPKEYLERGRFEQPDRSRDPAWARPVIANGKLYLRDQDALFCYDIKAR